MLVTRVHCFLDFSSSIDSKRCVFSQVVTYHSTEKLRKHKEIVVEVEQPVNKDTDTYDVTFDVPAVPPTGMIHCNIIDVLYTLKVRLSQI